jgi:hypothetical protein
VSGRVGGLDVKQVEVAKGEEMKNISSNAPMVCVCLNAHACLCW